MAQTAWSLRRLFRHVACAGLLCSLTAPVVAAARPSDAAPLVAQAGAAPHKLDEADLRIAAQVDRTTLDVGGRLTLTLIIEGNFSKGQLQPPEFPKAFQVIAQSRASNVSVQMGKVSRSVSLVYVLLAQEAGTFQLGPFTAIRQGQSTRTDPIDIVVNKPILPPQLKESPRYTL